MGAISQTNVNFVGSHCGISIGEDGPSQMGLEDIAMFRSIPGTRMLSETQFLYYFNYEYVIKQIICPRLKHLWSPFM